ncbi:MAG: hypothetical protein HKN92_02085 [Chitinophagales bacterium]|nr:hypothetical protein [Chitinophagales bacterium]
MELLLALLLFLSDGSDDGPNRPQSDKSVNQKDLVEEEVKIDLSWDVDDEEKPNIKKFL